MIFALLGVITLFLVLNHTMWRAFPEFFSEMFDTEERDAPHHRGLFFLLGLIMACSALVAWPIIWTVFLYNRREQLKDTFHEFFN